MNMGKCTWMYVQKWILQTKFNDFIIGNSEQMESNMYHQNDKHVDIMLISTECP